MMFKSRYILPLLLTFIALAVPGAWGEGTSVKASLDNPSVTMGHLVSYDVEVVEPEGSTGQLLFITDQIPPQVEMHHAEQADTTSLGSNMRQINYHFILQSFDSGLYTLPPVVYINGGDTLLSDLLSLKVNPVDVSELEDIHPTAGTFDGEWHWYDYLPDWMVDYWGWLLLGVLLIAGGLCAVLIATNRMPNPLAPVQVIIPPYEMAMQRLQQLKTEKLCEKGQEKQYYSELTDILREYLQRRFGINALEMTSRQILESVRKNPETRNSRKLIADILDVADFVKFARLKPIPEDNTRSYNSALQFINDTRPVEPQEEEDDKDENNTKIPDIPASKAVNDAAVDKDSEKTIFN